MAKFLYVARDSKGKKVSAVEDGASSDEIITRLHARGLIVISVTSQSREEMQEYDSGGLPARLQKFSHNSITNDDLVIFCRQLATLLGAAVTILKSLETISKQVSSRRLFNTIKELERDMEAGLSLHEAMAKHPKVFSELWVNLAETGEASGNLANVLNRLASYLERNAAFRKKIITSLIYPLILLFASLGALLFLTVRIIPTFAELFKGFNVTLPLFTRVLISVSFFLRQYLLVITVATGVGIYLLKLYIGTKEGRLMFEKLEFKLPVFGEFFRAIIVERFSSGMSTLVESGVPILYSLEIAEHSISNLTMANVIRRIKEDVREGRPLSATLQKSGFFEPMVVQMVAVGEEVGDLPQMFNRINLFYQEYAETFLTRFTSMFEPLMLIFMGLIIGLMVVGMFLPIFKIATVGG